VLVRVSPREVQTSGSFTTTTIFLDVGMALVTLCRVMSGLYDDSGGQCFSSMDTLYMICESCLSGTELHYLPLGVDTKN
jgi:hypothetical protein